MWKGEWKHHKLNLCYFYLLSVRSTLFTRIKTSINFSVINVVILWQSGLNESLKFISRKKSVKMKKNFRVLQNCLTFHHFTRRKLSSKSHIKLSIVNDNISWIGVNVMNRNFSSYHKEMENIVRSPYTEVVVPEIPLPNFLWDENSKILGDKVALVS